MANAFANARSVGLTHVRGRSHGSKLHLHTRFSRVSAVSWRCTRTARHTRTPCAAGVNGSAPVTDDAVPEGHAGLHDTLYGDGGAESEHEAGDYEFRKGEDEGEVLIPVAEYLATRKGERPTGVFAVYDAARAPQYVSISRNMCLALSGLLKGQGEDRVAFVRAMVFANRAMASRANLQKEADNWLDAFGTLPPGNGVEKEEWDAQAALRATNLSAEESQAYEDRKFKMRKAMADKGLAAEEEEDTRTNDEKASAMRNAMERGDWSAVIDEQTAEAVGQLDEQEEEDAAESPNRVVSPFTSAMVHRTVGEHPDEASSAPKAMTVESVDAVLEEVRPYLIADGGNVEVVEVDKGIVYLRLQGACGSCSSSTATMEMGIKRCLRSNFGDQLIDVAQVDAMDFSASVTSINEHLEMLRPAIENYGGRVEVKSIEDGVCNVEYEGPKPISMGIRAAILDRYPELKEVNFM